MSTDVHGQTERLIRASFEGRARPDQLGALLAHLLECDRCMAAYDRRLLLSEIDPEGQSPIQRLAIGLGLSRPRKKSRPWVPLAAGGLAVAAVVLLAALWWPAGAGDPAGQAFHARSAGDPDRSNSLVVYRLSADGAPAVVAEAIPADAELAFAYRNPAGKRRLMIFATDTTGTIYWYYPAWRSKGEESIAVPIEQNPGLIELPEAVRHELHGERLTIYALFTNRELSTRQLEEQLISSDLGDIVEQDDTLLEVVDVEVRH